MTLQGSEVWTTRESTDAAGSQQIYEEQDGQGYIYILFVSLRSRGTADSARMGHALAGLSTILFSSATNSLYNPVAGILLS